MSLLLKRISPLSVLVTSLAFFSLSGINPKHLVAAEEEDADSNGTSYLSSLFQSATETMENKVYPINSSDPQFEGMEAQSNESTDAQDELLQAVWNGTGSDDTSEWPGPESNRSQQLKNAPLPPRGHCSADEEEHPADETVELYDALNIMEHITGLDHRLNDPEEIRMRAYIGERHADLGVQIILEDETHFWESSLVDEDIIEESEEHYGDEDLDNDLDSLGDIDGEGGFTLRQKTDVEDEDGGGDLEEEEEEEEEEALIEVKEGARIRLVCNVTGVPTYWVEWRRGANLSFPGGASVVGGRSVLLDYVGREDSGTYSCTVTTPSGYTHTSDVSMKVHYAPVVGVWARDVDTNRVELGCLVEARPRPSLAWYKNNTKLSPSNCPSNMDVKSSVLSSRFVLSVLSLTNVSFDDFAYYHCRASNTAGVSRAYVMLQDESGILDLEKLYDMRPVKHPAPLENPRLSSFLLGMVPPLYIGLYIIAYLGCYKTSISGMGGHGRFGAGVDINE